MHLSASHQTPLIRTDFSSDETWERVVNAALSMSADGFQAVLDVVNDRSFDNVDPANLANAADEINRALIVIADAFTMADSELPILCVNPKAPRESFRVRPDHLWAVENNVSLRNMDFAEFAIAVDPDGVFRGFRD